MVESQKKYPLPITFIYLQLGLDTKKKRQEAFALDKITLNHFQVRLLIPLEIIQSCIARETVDLAGDGAKCDTSKSKQAGLKQSWAKQNVVQGS